MTSRLGHLLRAPLDRWRESRTYESTGLRRWLHQLVNPAAVLLAGVASRPTRYVDVAPSPQNALDLFKGEWSSALPPPCDRFRAGAMPLFADDRLRWALGELGGVAGKTVVELGPLEGAHTYMLEAQGASSIVAVEAHPRAFLRALVLKEVLGLVRARFLLGDFVAFLGDAATPSFDVGIASGVLYHLSEPVTLIARLAERCEAVYLWTHYYDERQIARRPNVGARFGRPETRRVGAFEHVIHPYRYQADRYDRVFCGGARPTAAWLDRETLLEAMRVFGFDDVRIGLEEPDHIHGPSLALVATRRRRPLPVPPAP